MKRFYILVLFFSFFFISCENKKNKADTYDEVGQKVKLKYAKGFSITKYNSHIALEIKNPWPNSKKIYNYYLSNILPKGINNKYPKHSILKTPLDKVVVTSTTHVPFLELLNVEHTLVGFPGLDYISSSKTRTLISKNNIRELGKNDGLNTEVLLALQPNAVIGFGIDGTNRSFETIKKSGIPVVYNGDWVENSPLAKAEWIKFFGVLYNKEKEADSIFNQIETNYLKSKQIAFKAKNTPTVLSGAMHKDIWYLPSGLSPEAQFLTDANVNYLWKDSNEKGSLSLSFETVYEKGRSAEIWLNPSYYSSYEALKEANSHYINFDAFKNKSIYSVSNTTGETGGVLYYELGIARPDLVLKDVIKICHPELLPDYKPFFFKKLK